MMWPIYWDIVAWIPRASIPGQAKLISLQLLLAWRTPNQGLTAFFILGISVGFYQSSGWVIIIVTFCVQLPGGGR